MWVLNFISGHTIFIPEKVRTHEFNLEVKSVARACDSDMLHAH